LGYLAGEIQRAFGQWKHLIFAKQIHGSLLCLAGKNGHGKGSQLTLTRAQRGGSVRRESIAETQKKIGVTKNGA